MIPLKTRQEIGIMKEGGQRLAQVMKETLVIVKPGMALSQINQLIEELILKKDGQPSFKMVPGYHWASCLNVNQGVVHGVPGDYRLKENDFLSLDIGLFFKGFHTDMARTVKVSVGKNKNQDDEFLKVGEKALVKAIEMARVGNHVGHLSQAMEKEIRKAGFSPIEVLTGHGVGRKLHEAPPIPCLLWGPIKSTPKLEAGMTLAVEVIYAQGSPEVVLAADNWTIETADNKLAGLFEETIVIQPGKPLILTAFN
ncbi:type I methionyl aminopeptidase [Patescibacteria group bacterium]|nr:type I methionyl aminopeptidase [Patescibacteria group bacterium]